MKALIWNSRGDIRCESVPDPRIEDGRDVIIKVTACAICGSDLHLMDGLVPTMQRGDVLGHETMGEVVETGRDHSKFKVGDRIVVPFTICCGDCRMCRMQLWSACERTNPNGAMQAEQYGYRLAGLFGYSHITGGYAGGQAEYMRVPYADVAPIKVPDGMSDEAALFLSDIFPTGYMAAENCDIQPTDTVAVWGCGPVGLFSIQSARLLGARRVIAVDFVAERLGLARELGAETLDANEGQLQARLLDMTDGQGPDKVIEAVGCESHGAESLLERAASAVQSSLSSTERPYALNQAILACRPGGIVSVPGVYVAYLGPVAMGAFMQKGLTLRTGQTHVPRYLKPLLERIERGEIDPTQIITHTSDTLEDGPELYRMFRAKEKGCVKVVIRPHG